MRVIGLVLVLAMLSTGATGCALFGKKEGSGERSGGWFKKKDTSSANPPPPKFPDPIVAPPGAPPPLPAGPAAQNTSATEIALLAGRVVDAYNQPVANSYVQLVQLDSTQEAGSPVDVAASGDGYFTIPNLRPGSQYKLIARTKLGEKLLAGIAIRQAPDVHVVIQVKEEFASAAIPPLPSGQEKRDAKPTPTSGLDSSVPPVAIWSPTPSGTVAPPTPAAVDLPAKLTVPRPAASTNPTSPGVASTQNAPWPPPLQINGGPNKTSEAPKPFPPQPPLPPASDAQSKLTPLVPSSVVVAGTVQILALKDVDEQTWNFHKDRKGKIVLLDFWKRGCQPCLHTMPILTQMQTKYGPQGVEIVGVFIDSGSLKEQAERAKKTCYQFQTNYRQVLGQDDKTRLTEQFNLHGLPTLILLDNVGRVLWRYAGTPDAAMLEHVLQKHLAASRAF